MFFVSNLLVIGSFLAIKEMRTICIYKGGISMFLEFLSKKRKKPGP